MEKRIQTDFVLKGTKKDIELIEKEFSALTRREEVASFKINEIKKIKEN